MCDALREVLEWQAWSLDDGVLLGTPEQLGRALELVVCTVSQWGMEVNLSNLKLCGLGASN